MSSGLKRWVYRYSDDGSGNVQKRDRGEEHPFSGFTPFEVVCCMYGHRLHSGPPVSSSRLCLQAHLDDHGRGSGF